MDTSDKDFQIKFLKDEIKKANAFRKVQAAFCVLCFIAALSSTNKAELFLLLLGIVGTGVMFGILTEDVDNKKIEIEELEKD